MSPKRTPAAAPAASAAPAPSWLTARADSGGVPALLQRLIATVPAETMDEVWIFPTRRMPGFESTVVVLSLFTDDADRRRVATAHFKAVRNKRGEATVETILSDHAVAPPDRLERIIDGVMRRLGDDSVLATPPRSARIRGHAERWTALVQAVEGGQEIPEFDGAGAAGGDAGDAGDEAETEVSAETETEVSAEAETEAAAETHAAADSETQIEVRDEALVTDDDVQTENEETR